MKPDVKRIQAAALDAAVPGTWTTLSEEQLERYTREFSARLIQHILYIIDDRASEFSAALDCVRNEIADRFE